MKKNYRATSIVVKHKGFTYLLRKNGMNVLPSHFIYKYKRSPCGDLLSRKARFVAGGHKQEYEVDYFETYSATTQLESVRFMLAVAASRSLMLAKFDIETFFLYGTPDTDIFIEQHQDMRSCQKEHQRVRNLLTTLFF